MGFYETLYLILSYLILSFSLAFALFNSTNEILQMPKSSKIKIGEHQYSIIESPHPYPSSRSGNIEIVWEDYFFFKDASYIVFRFENIELSFGDFIEIQDSSGNLIEKIEENNSNFLSKIIFSNFATLKIYSSRKNNSCYGYKINRITIGYPEAFDIINYFNESFVSGICGNNDMKNAKCYDNSQFSDIYKTSKAVAKVIYDGSQVSGTAFLCSCENDMLTNLHVIQDQNTLNITHFLFNYEDPQCENDGNITGFKQCKGGQYKKGGGTSYDYSLIKLNLNSCDKDFDPQRECGYIKLNTDLNITNGKKFFISGHPGGRGKEITYFSDRTVSGICEIKDLSVAQCSPFQNYYAAYSFLCDIEAGSSGSPMVSLDNLRAIGIVDCDGCPNEDIGNKGVMLSKFISEIKPHLPECSYKYTISGNIEGNSTDVGNVEIYVDNLLMGLSTSNGFYETNPIDKGIHKIEPQKHIDQNGNDLGYYCFNPKDKTVSIDYMDLENVDFNILYYNVSGNLKIAFTTKPLNGATVYLHGHTERIEENTYNDNTFNFTNVLCGNYIIEAKKQGVYCPSDNFTLSYSNYSTTIYCALVVSGRVGPLYPSNMAISVSGIATNGQSISQEANIDANGYFVFYLPEGSYSFIPYSECNIFYPPILQTNVTYEKPKFLDFTTTLWKVCSSCYSTYFAREYECLNLSDSDKENCLSNAKIEFKNCAILQTKNANSSLYNAIILAVEIKRAKGKPEEEIYEFYVENEGDYFINLTNGNGLQKETSLSSARIILDEENEIFNPNDFNKNVFKLSKIVHLSSGFHNIKVQVESKPDSYLTILISDKNILSMLDLP